MSDEQPQRLLDSNPGSLAAQLLRASADERLDPVRKEHIWQSIAQKLPPQPGDPDGSSNNESSHAPSNPTAPEGAGPTNSAATVVDAAMLGGFKFGAGLFLIVAGAWWAWSWDVSTTAPPARVERPAPSSAAVLAPVPPAQSSRPEATESSHHVVPVVSATNVASTRQALPVEPARLAFEPKTIPLPSKAPSPPVDAPAQSASATTPSPAEVEQQEKRNLVLEETQMVREARSVLRSGNAAKALEKLDEIQKRFGGQGQLLQERDALRIEALAKTNQTHEAQTRAREFLKNHPESPLTQDVKPFSK